MHIFPLTGISLIIAFVVCIVLMILAISKLKLHPFLSIMTVALLLALVAEFPLIRSHLPSAPASPTHFPVSAS